MNLEFDHVAVAVRSMTELESLLERLTGLAGSPVERVETQEVEVSFVGPVEVIRPTSPDSGVARFLDKRGPGLHHIAYRVADVASAMAELQGAGYHFTTDTPTVGRGGRRIAFLHPSATGGVLIELVEKPLSS